MIVTRSSVVSHFLAIEIHHTKFMSISPYLFITRNNKKNEQQRKQQKQQTRLEGSIVCLYKCGE